MSFRLEDMNCLELCLKQLWEMDVFLNQADFSGPFHRAMWPVCFWNYQTFISFRFNNSRWYDAEAWGCNVNTRKSWVSPMASNLIVNLAFYCSAFGRGGESSWTLGSGSWGLWCHEVTAWTSYCISKRCVERTWAGIKIKTCPYTNI